MTKSTFITLCIMSMLFLCGCTSTTEAQINREAPDSGLEEEVLDSELEEAAICFLHGIRTADIWILPATKENRETTLWGTPTIGKLAPHEERRLSLKDLGGSGMYLIRAIDEKGMYYAVDDVSLEAGYTLRLEETRPLSAVLVVMDADGASVAADRGFVGRL